MGFVERNNNVEYHQAYALKLIRHSDFSCYPAMLKLTTAALHVAVFSGYYS